MDTIDLHLHTSYSDGDCMVKEVVAEVIRRKLAGFSITDHNGVWGLQEARILATKANLRFVDGIELSARVRGMDVHVLGYSEGFDADLLHKELLPTQQGYMERAYEMIKKCQEAGYEKVSWEAVLQRRANEEYPMFLSYDVRRELMEVYGLDHSEARSLTTIGGTCHVPYGAWALTPIGAMELIHKANGVSVLAHPGTIAFEQSQHELEELLGDCVAAGLRGVEGYHPFHQPEFVSWVESYATQHNLIVTGGSDWHGHDHFIENDRQFGSVGISSDAVDRLLQV